MAESLVRKNYATRCATKVFQKLKKRKEKQKKTKKTKKIKIFKNPCQWTTKNW